MTGTYWNGKRFVKPDEFTRPNVPTPPKQKVHPNHQSKTVKGNPK